MTENTAASKCTGHEKENDNEENDKIEQKMETSEVKINIVDDENKSNKRSSEIINTHEMIEAKAIENLELDNIQDGLIENQMKTINNKKTFTVYMQYPYPQSQQPYPQQQYAQQPYPQQQYAQQPYAQHAYEQYPPQYQEQNQWNPDSGSGGGSLEYTSDKNSFIRKVFILVFIMVCFTAAVTYVVYTRHDIQKKIRMKIGKFCLLAATGVLWAVNYSFCCMPCTRKVPCNFIVIIMGTLAYSYIIAFITSKYQPNVVLGAVGSTVLTALVCLVLACTSFDFTSYLLIAVVASVGLAFALMFSVLLSKIFGINLSTLSLIILCVSTVVSSVVFVIELQMILGGKSVEIGEDDYAYAAYLVYTSLLDLFIKFLQIANQSGIFGGDGE